MGTDSRRLALGRAWSQAVVWACAVVLALGAVPIHAPGDAGHVDSLVGAATEETVFACLDEHPRTPHVETARPVRRPACPACLHRLEGRGWLTAAAQLTGLVASPAAALPPVGPAVPRPDLERPAPRGPPLV